ncbi:MAG: hypothetical protein ABSE66_09840 [Thermoplasmata archaeon]|jgi:hypothetical protein
MPAVVASVLAGDSGTPRPGGYGFQVVEPDGRWVRFAAYGVYVGGPGCEHVWERGEVAALHAEGVEAAFPIVVPPQTWPWMMPEDEVLIDLVREAEAWPVPQGSPLILDLEQWQATRMGSQLSNVIALFAGAARAARFEPVIYGGATTIAAAGVVGRFLARWARPAGSPPPPAGELPPGLFAWQYAGNVAAKAGAVDLDLLAVPVVLMATDFSVASGLVIVNEGGTVTPVLSRQAPGAKVPAIRPEGQPVPEPAEPTPEEITAAETVAPPAASATPPPLATPAAGPVGAPVEYVQLPEGGAASYVDIAVVGDGYYALTGGGHVVAVRAPHLGEPNCAPCVAIGVTPSGLGYYVLTDRGEVFHYGDAGTKAAADEPEGVSNA